MGVHNCGSQNSSNNLSYNRIVLQAVIAEAQMFTGEERGGKSGCGVPKLTYLNTATTTALHQIADVSWLNGRSNECIDVVVTKFLQLRMNKHTSYVFTAARKATQLIMLLSIRTL